MTNKQIAEKLAKRIIQTELKLSALEGYLDALQRMENPPSDWQKDIRRDHVFVDNSLEAAQRVSEIVALIHGAKELELLQILGRTILDIPQ
jgi:predicted RNA methylase